MADLVVGPQGVAGNLQTAQGVGANLQNEQVLNAAANTKQPQPGMQQGKPGDPGYIENVYLNQKDKKFADAATGETIFDLIKFKTGGNIDFQQKLKLFIRREYWTSAQVMNMAVLGFSLGMALMLIVFIFSYDLNYNLFSRRGLVRKLGIFLTFMGVGIIFSKFAPHYIKQCKPGAKGVDRNLERHQCLENRDCTRSNRVYSGACNYPVGNAFEEALRFILRMLVLVGIGMWIASAASDDLNNPPSTTQDQWVSAVMGFAFGNILSFVTYT